MSETVQYGPITFWAPTVSGRVTAAYARSARDFHTSLKNRHHRGFFLIGGCLLWFIVLMVYAVAIEFVLSIVMIWATTYAWAIIAVWTAQAGTAVAQGLYWLTWQSWHRTEAIA